MRRGDEALGGAGAGDGDGYGDEVRKRTCSPEVQRRVYNSMKWRRLRKRHLEAEPLCRICQKEGRLTAATEVDHVLPLAFRGDLAYITDNFQSLCKPCHSTKTAREGWAEGGGLPRPAPRRLNGADINGDLTPSRAEREDTDTDR